MSLARYLPDTCANCPHGRPDGTAFKPMSHFYKRDELTRWNWMECHHNPKRPLRVLDDHRCKKHGEKRD